MKQLLNVPSVRSVAQDKSILKKTQSKKKSSTSVKGGGGLSSRIASINATVEQYLGKYKEQYRCITTKEELNKYIDKCIEDGICAIDTETTGLDPMQDQIVGFSICCPTLLKHPAYIPLNHVSFVTGQRVKEQMSIDDAKECLDRLTGYREMIVMFNGVFDCRVIKNQVGVLLKCFWDTSVASRCMNENEQKGQKGLKKLHQKYVLKGQEDAFKFDELFDGLNFALVPIKTGFLYAAHDARITLEFYEYQKQYLYYDPTQKPEARNGMNGVSWMFLNIEMPIVEVDVELEDTGVALDFDYCKELQEKYSKLLKKAEKECYKIVDMYKDEIAQYSGSVHLDDPINLSSPKQLAVLLYDIMGEKPVDKDSPRGTGEKILAKMKTPLGKAILEYRSIEKLMGTYIEKMPAVVNKKDKRVHCKFNQYGADTGRFSSNDPNLQNIPSHNKDIRKMFKATDGYVMMSADYSQQEPKVMTMMCKDPLMIDAYQQGKDLYAQIASLSFNTSYRECLEFMTNEDGSFVLDENGEKITYPAGKERRSQAKSILLGVLYGRGVPSIAEQLGVSTKKAQQIKDSVMKGFPAIGKFEEDSLEMAETLGYVTTLWGRKRRLPVLMHNDYEFEYTTGAGMSGDPLDFDDDGLENEEVPEKICRQYTRELDKTWDPSKREAIKNQAKVHGIIIHDYRNDRQKATRQVVNSRIQGSAADMSKLAMIKLFQNERLKELGFRMLIPVHDEIIAECPKENTKEVVELFSKIMSEAPGDKFTIPISCDVEVSDRWYGKTVEFEDSEDGE